MIIQMSEFWPEIGLRLHSPDVEVKVSLLGSVFFGLRRALDGFCDKLLWKTDHQRVVVEIDLAA